MIQVFRSKVSIYGLKKLMEDILETTGYVEFLKETEEEDAEDRIENIDELITKIAIETKGFTVISKADCEALTMKISEILKTEGE